VSVAFVAARVMEPEKPIRRRRNTALSAPLYWSDARASVSPPDVVSMRASVPDESSATIIGRCTDPHVAGDALSTR
jgi:hypothetical protein